MKPSENIKNKKSTYTSTAPAVDDASRTLIVLSNNPSSRMNLTDIVKNKYMLFIEEYACWGCKTDACTFNAIALDKTNGIAAKCNLCYNRIDNGLYPACADNVYLAHCIYFGKPEEIEKIINEKPWTTERIELAKRH